MILSTSNGVHVSISWRVYVFYGKLWHVSKELPHDQCDLALVSILRGVSTKVPRETSGISPGERPKLSIHNRVPGLRWFGVLFLDTASLALTLPPFDPWPWALLHHLLLLGFTQGSLTYAPVPLSTPHTWQPDHTSPFLSKVSSCASEPLEPPFSWELGLVPGFTWVTLFSTFTHL